MLQYLIKFCIILFSIICSLALIQIIHQSHSKCLESGGLIFYNYNPECFEFKFLTRKKQLPFPINPFKIHDEYDDDNDDFD